MTPAPAAGYSVGTLESVGDDLENLPDADRRQIYEAIRALANNPRPPGGERLKTTHFMKIRVGNYRIVYEVDDRQRQVTVVRIGDRKEVYQRIEQLAKRRQKIARGARVSQRARRPPSRSRHDRRGVSGKRQGRKSRG